MMKQILQARLSQQITLTPQLAQAIRLLQLSAQDLTLEIQKALESNPMLEIKDDNSSTEEELIYQPGQVDETLSVQEPAPEVRNEQTEYTENYSEELSPLDRDWNSSTNRSHHEDSDIPYPDIKDTSLTSLHQYLLWQMRLTPFSETDTLIAETIIDSISDDGYLTYSLEEIQESLARNTYQMELDEIEAVLHRIQQFDPPGVGSRNLQEFLLFQLNQLPNTVLEKTIAKDIIIHHLDLLAKQEYKYLCQTYKAPEQNTLAAIKLIKSLKPRPNYEITESEPHYIIPDVIVYKANGAWQVELNQAVTPHLQINRKYAALLNASKQQSHYQQLRDQMQEARWLLKSLASRNQTLLKVTQCIVEKQREFLENGAVAMKPMVLQDVAYETGLHESTISRITNQKYMQTQQGVFELKYFFSSHVQTDNGNECSSTAIRAFIKRLIAEEDVIKPLSDNQIANLLESKRGIHIARRTITKYRESLHIPPSTERKKSKQALLLNTVDSS